MKKEKDAKRAEKKKVKTSRSKITRIYPVSFGKFVSILWAMFGVIIALAINIFFPEFLANIGGRASIVLLPLIYGVYGFIIGLVCAVIFNVIAKRLKGIIEVDVTKVSSD